MRKYIITGGPCSGKTSIIEEIARRGHPVLHEVARSIISEEQTREKAFGSYKGVFPWTDLARFQEFVVRRQIYREADAADKKHEKIFLDRSIVDSVAYAMHGKVALDGKVHDLIREAGYEKDVFVPLPLPYCNDSVRAESEEMARAVHETILALYKELGHKIHYIPLFEEGDVANSVKRRAEFVLGKIEEFEGRRQKNLLMNTYVGDQLRGMIDRGEL